MIASRPLIAMIAAFGMLGAATLGLLPGASAEGAPAHARVAPAGPVLLELFTSQGCSSCPPADRLAEQLAADPGLVVIARPVTYWDRLGWQDTLAREANTALQQDYARRGLAGENGVYTPQLVVNGTFGAVGSRRDDIVAGIARHGGKGGAAIRVSGSAAKGYAADLSGAASGKAELVLLSVSRRVEVGIGRGENRGRKVAYTNVLRAETPIARWQGGAARIVIAPDRLRVPGADRFALVLREPEGGKVLAARWLS